MRKRLTTNLITTAKPQEKPFAIHDTEIEGLHVEVRPTGKKLFKVRVLKGEGRNKKLSLGEFPALGVDDAREQAQEWLSQFDKTMPKSEADKLKAFGERSFDDVIKEYILSLCQEHGVDGSDPVYKWRPRSIVQKRNTLNKLCKDLKAIYMIPEDEPFPMRMLTHERLALWHQENPSRYAANRTIDYLRYIMKDYVKKGLLDKSPTDDIKKFVEKERTLSLKHSDLLALLDALENHVENKVAGSALIVMARTGQRPEEIHMLMHDDDRFGNYVDWRNSELVLRNTKTIKTDRTTEQRVGVPPRAMELLKSQKKVDGNPYIFPGKRGSHVSYDVLRDTLDEAKKHVIENDLVDEISVVQQMTMYVLRHTFATLAAIAGWSTQDIANQLKHRNVSTTMKYIKRAEEYKTRLAAKADDLI